MTIRKKQETTRVIDEAIERLKARIIDLRQEKGIAAVRELEARRKMLRKLREESLEREKPSNNIFLSHSGTGTGYAEIAARIADEYGFVTTTGFDDVILRGDNLAQAIMSHIRSSDYFLGIWTDDFQAESRPGEDYRGNRIEQLPGTVPSVWLPFELGVAASHEKPFRLLVLKNTHKYYYEKPFNLTPQILFSPDEFEQKCRSAIEVFDDKRAAGQDR